MNQASAGFSAYVAHPSLGEDAVWGTLFFSGWRLRFESSTVVREILLVKLRIQQDESGEGGVVFYDPDDPEWTIHTLDGGILAHPLLQQQPHTRNQIRAVQSRGEVARRLRLIGYFLGGFVVVALLVSMLMSWMVRALVARVPVEWEQELGNKVMAELRQKEKFVDDQSLMTNVMSAVAPLLRTVPNHGMPYHFYLMDYPLPNAFALPGGHVVITTSLFKLVDRPEDIAGVVAHELAHVTLRHGFRKIISSAGPYFLCRLFMRDNSGLLGLLAGSSQLLVCQSFSQEYELEADDVGWDYLVQAHIDPRGLPDMLRKLKEDRERMNVVQLEPQAFSSHPPTETRIRRLEAKWQNLKDKSGFIKYEKPNRK